MRLSKEERRANRPYRPRKPRAKRAKGVAKAAFITAITAKEIEEKKEDLSGEQIEYYAHYVPPSLIGELRDELAADAAWDALIEIEENNKKREMNGGSFPSIFNNLQKKKRTLI